MALKNKSMYAILGILSLAPSTGYDIKTYSDKVLSGFWHENFGHIYPTLKRMLADGTIEVDRAETNARRIRYAITDKGRREMDAWLAERTEQQPVRSEFLLKLLFSSGQPARRVTEMLASYKEQHARNKERYLRMRDDLRGGIPGISPERARRIDAVLRNGEEVCDAVIRWCDETAREFDGSDRG